MTWYLNKFLSTWRNAVDDEYPLRSKKSDGTIGDTRHQTESFSEHNPDRDGSVDAWDMDVNIYGSRNDTGTAAELAHIEDLKREFQRQQGAQLWIHKGTIANKDIGNWKRRPYHGDNRHDHHVHWQSDQDYEKRAFKGDLDDDIVVTALNDSTRKAVPKVIPPWPAAGHKGFMATAKYSVHVLRAQTRLKERGWKIVKDGIYGPASAHTVALFQSDKKLKRDGVLGPITWRALWASPITDD